MSWTTSARHQVLMATLSSLLGYSIGLAINTMGFVRGYISAKEAPTQQCATSARQGIDDEQR